MKSGSEKNLNKWKKNNKAETVVCQKKLAIVCVFPDARTGFYYYFQVFANGWNSNGI